MVQVEGMERLLKEHAFFQDFDAAALKDIAGCAASQTFEAGQVLFREGEPADRFFIIRHGDVAIEMGVPAQGQLTLQTLHEGDVVGWSWLVPPHKWSFSARATSLVRTLSLDAAALRAKMDANHELGYRLLQRFMPVMASRLTAARLQMLDLYAAPAGAKR